MIIEIPHKSTLLGCLRFLWLLLRGKL